MDYLLAIGGDGTFRGCVDLGLHWSGAILGLPGTIDNDVWGTDYTIGFDTAVNTAVESIDKIRDTAESHDRFFLVEVMGRHSGFIALEVRITGGRRKSWFRMRLPASMPFATGPAPGKERERRAA